MPLLILAALTACAGSQPTKKMIQYSELSAGPAVPADQRIAYGSEPLQFGELRLPNDGNATVALVVLIHGGCWQAQYDMKHVSAVAAALVKEGVAVWTIEYRRVGDVGGGWPGTFDDVGRAVDHVRALAAGHPRIDLTRVVLMGHSAGGQLALWAASRKQNEMNGLYPSSMPPLPVAGVISLAGITDLAAYGAGAGSCSGAVTPLMGGTPDKVGERYRAVSPMERVPIGVPVRLVHGASDPIVPLAQSTNFQARVKAAGGEADVDVVAGAGHFDLVAPQAEAWTTVVRAVHALVDVPAQPKVHTGS
ncbi:MAG: alpha/beta hydrolase [Gemmatimonadetes bacterium]|nr:alpha/beta hydrolase [Gemmatimonadota bacterium]